MRIQGDSEWCQHTAGGILCDVWVKFENFAVLETVDHSKISYLRLVFELFFFFAWLALTRAQMLLNWQDMCGNFLSSLISKQISLDFLHIDFSFVSYKHWTFITLFFGVFIGPTMNENNTWKLKSSVLRWKKAATGETLFQKTMWILKFPLSASNGSEPATIQKIENILTLVAIIILKPQRKRKDRVCW